MLPLKNYGLDVEQLEKISNDNNVELEIITSKSNDVKINKTDLLFIDTDHTYECLKEELTLHGNKSNKYIILHDTTTFGVVGGDGGRGLQQAVDEFLIDNKHWLVHEKLENNNGLTILKKK